MRKFRILFLALAILLVAGPPAPAQNIEIDTSSPFLYPEYSKKISMDFQEAALDDVLKIFSQQTGFNLITAESVSGRRVTVYLDKVPVEQALEQLLRANNLTYEIQPGSNIYVVKSLPQPGVELITRVYTLKHATVKEAQIQKTLKVEGVGQTTTGGLSDTVKSLLTSQGKLVEDPRTNSLIVSDIASNFPSIENAIAKLDVPVPQILIEVEMLEVAKGTVDLIGNKIGITNTPLLGLSGAQKESFFPFEKSGALAYTKGVVDFQGLAAALQFLRTQTGTKTLARPRILTLNNQAAEIRISTDEAVGTTTTASSGSNFTSESAERTNTGIFLTVTPQANLFTGEITMAVIPKEIIARTSSLSKSFKDPEERSSQSLLRIQDGDTIIIGGLIRQSQSRTITKVPLLGDIPFVGALFRHRDESITDKELIVFLTPHIINETPVQKVTAANIRRLDREQDAPQSAGAEPLTAGSSPADERTSDNQ